MHMLNAHIYTMFIIAHLVNYYGAAGKVICTTPKYICIYADKSVHKRHYTYSSQCGCVI